LRVKTKGVRRRGKEKQMRGASGLAAAVGSKTSVEAIRAGMRRESSACCSMKAERPTGIIYNITFPEFHEMW
jgi:hypothetical protein